MYRRKRFRACKSSWSTKFWVRDIQDALWVLVESMTCWVLGRCARASNSSWPTTVVEVVTFQCHIEFSWNLDDLSSWESLECVEELTTN